MFRIAALPLILLSAAALDATTVVRFPFGSLCTNADRILHVRCLDSDSEADGETGRIHTRTRFKVLEVIKGVDRDDAPADLELVLPGGALEDRREFVAGMPAFQPGKETVLFLTVPSDSGSPWPLGLYQGCYSVSVDETGERQVHLQAGVTPLPEGSAFKAVTRHPFRVGFTHFLDAVRANLPIQEAPANTVPTLR